MDHSDLYGSFWFWQGLWKAPTEWHPWKLRIQRPVTVLAVFFVMIWWFFNPESEGHRWKQCREVPHHREVLSQPNKSLDLPKALPFDLLQGLSDWRGTPKSERACTQSFLPRHTRAMLLMLKHEFIHVLGVVFFCLCLSLSLSKKLFLYLSIFFFPSFSFSSFSLSLYLLFIAMDEVPFAMTKETKQDLWMTLDIWVFLHLRDISTILCIG